MEEEDKYCLEPDHVDILQSSTNDNSEQKSVNLPLDQSRTTAVYEPLPNTNAIDSIMNAETEKGAYDKEPLPSGVELISNMKHFL